MRNTVSVHISAKSDYAVRAALRLATAEKGPVKGEAIARAENIPPKFLEAVLRSLRHAGLVNSQRGTDGGYWLSKPAQEISVADVIRAVDGPLARVRGESPDRVNYEGPAAPLQDVWIAVRASVREVLEGVTLADLADNALPGRIRDLTARPDAWTQH